MLSALVVSAVLLLPATAAPSIVKRLTIQNGPAPPPGLGAPGAVNADRDPSHLKYEIIAIVGSYAVFTFFTILLVVFVGRKLRRRTLESNQSLHMVMLKPFPQQNKSPNLSMTTPKSPGRLSGMKPWSKKGAHKGNMSEYSISTVASYDEAHRAKNMEELSDLYAAVMAHDEEKESHASISTLPRSSDSFYTPVSPKVVPEMAHLYHSNQLPHPMAPTPVDDHFPEDTYDAQVSRSSTRTTRTTPLSIISELSTKAGGLMSPKKPRRISVKDQRISQPMGSADLQEAHFYSDNVPLSPRLYNPGPPPPTPGQSRSQQQPQPNPQHGFDRIQVHKQAQSRDRKVPASLTLRPAAASSSSSIPANGSQTAVPSRAPKALPFREVYGDASLRSAPPTKTTFVDRPDKHQGGMRSAMRTGVVPHTPYSPYMPFTPLTPITPSRLATRGELKQKRKEERLKVLDENDLVQDEGWGA